jgi:hypothetical protein
VFHGEVSLDVSSGLLRCGDEGSMPQTLVYNEIPPTVTSSNAVLCSYRFLVVLTVNRDYFLKQR